MISAKMTQKIVTGIPVRLVAEGLRRATFLENPAADAPRLDSSRTRPSGKVTPQPLALSRRDGDADAFDNQICLPPLTAPAAEGTSRQPRAPVFCHHCKARRLPNGRDCQMGLRA
jgi:hypothetical protein